MYCHIEAIGSLDIARLKRAIELSGQLVPEILYSYDFKHGYFVNQCFTADDAVILNQPDFRKMPRWDLSQRPQLQIALCKETGKDTVMIGMSHILADGNGFLQYLYLLAGLYNGEAPSAHLQNQKNIAQLQNIRKIIIPCPANLRRFQAMADGLTVANMTGIYKRPTVEISPQHTFSTTLAQVQIEMTPQRSRHRCFAGIGN